MEYCGAAFVFIFAILGFCGTVYFVSRFVIGTMDQWTQLKGRVSTLEYRCGDEADPRNLLWLYKELKANNKTTLDLVNKVAEDWKKLLADIEEIKKKEEINMTAKQ